MDAESSVDNILILHGVDVAGCFFTGVERRTDSFGVTDAQYPGVHFSSGPLDILEARDCRRGYFHFGRSVLRGDDVNSNAEDFRLVHDVLERHGGRSSVFDRHFIYYKLVQKTETVK